jgi:hypothetical protein
MAKSDVRGVGAVTHAVEVPPSPRDASRRVPAVKSNGNRAPELKRGKGGFIQKDERNVISIPLSVVFR